MKLVFVGDVMIGRLVNEVLKHNVPKYVWGDTLPVIKSGDAKICNLECVISDFGRPWSATFKVFHFRSDSKNIRALKVAGVNVVSLANNHTLDFEYDALSDMLQVLDRSKILHSGAGRSLDEASSVAILEFGGKKIGFIAFTDNQPEWEATESRPGIFYSPIDLKSAQAKRLFNIVTQTRKGVDILIASVHWGPNWGHFPPAEHTIFGQALIDQGVDIVFGHSAHIFRGVEIYGGRPLIYSAGDFIDDYAVDEIERNDRSFIFVIETEGSRIFRLRLHPTLIRNFQAKLAKKEEAEEILLRMQKLCQELGTPSIWRPKEGFLEINL